MLGDACFIGAFVARHVRNGRILHDRCGTPARRAIFKRWPRTELHRVAAKRLLQNVTNPDVYALLREPRKNGERDGSTSQSGQGDSTACRLPPESPGCARVAIRLASTISDPEPVEGSSRPSPDPAPCVAPFPPLPPVQIPSWPLNRLLATINGSSASPEGKRIGQRPHWKCGAPQGVVGSSPMPSALGFAVVASSCY